MTDDSVYGSDKDKMWWRRVANSTAIILAVFIIIFGLAGLKLNRENKSIDILKETNEQLRETINSLTAELSATAARLSESKKDTERLEQEIFRLKVENASLKASENVQPK